MSLHHVQSYKRPSCALGVLLTGYLDKYDPNAYLTKIKRRFVVLTHESIHWFKRTQGYDLFGEERGSFSLGDISTVELCRGRRGSNAAEEGNGGSNGSNGEKNAIMITTTDFTKRVFIAASKEEANKWLNAINLAIKSRFLYRRETLSGLSFIQGLDDTETTASRPRIMLLSLVRAAPAAAAAEAHEEEEAQEVVLLRNVEYEKGVALPPFGENDRFIFTTANGATATLTGTDVLTHVKDPNNEERLKATLRGGGIFGGTLLFNTTLVKQGEAQDTTSSQGASPRLFIQLLLSFFKGENVVPLSCAVFLLLVSALSWKDLEEARRQSFSLSSFASLVEICREEKALGAMVLVAVGLLLHVLVLVLQDCQTLLQQQQEIRKEKEQEEAPVAAASAVLGGTVYLEIEDYVMPSPVAERGPGEGGASGAAEEGEGDGVLGEIPKRFIDGCLGDMTEAMRRWRLTVEWRRAFGTDSILDQPHPYFDLIKECYPHYYCMQGRSGDPVYIERSGQVDQARMRAAGCGVDELVWHYIYMTEFLYTKLYPSETAKTITVFDVEGVGIRDLAGDAFEFLRRSSSLIQEHYPERSLVIMIVNAPSWFSFLWKMIRPMVNERTQKKVKIVKGGKEMFECIKEFVDPKNIPKAYGGELSFGENGEKDPESCRWNSPEEIALRNHVHEVNKKFGVESKMA